MRWGRKVAGLLKKGSRAAREEGGKSVLSARSSVIVWARAIWLFALVLLGSTLMIGFPNLSEQKMAFQIQIRDKEPPPVGEDFLADIILKFASKGVQRYELIFHVGDSSGAGKIARIEKIESRTISPKHFQIVGKTDFSVWFKAVDVDNVIQPGASDVVIATITLRALLVGKSILRLEVLQASMVDDLGREVDPKEILMISTNFEVK